MFGTSFLIRFVLYGMSFVVFLALVFVFVFLVTKAARIFTTYMREHFSEEIKMWKEFFSRKNKSKNKKGG